MRTLGWLLVLLIAVTVFALSNTMIVSVGFWQWELFRGQLGLAIIGAGVIGALLTYAGSLGHHVRQARQIRRLQADAQPAATPLPVAGPTPHAVSVPAPRATGETPTPPP